MKTWGFAREPSGELYIRLLHASLELGQVVGLIHQRLPGGGYQEPLEGLTPLMIDEAEVSEWPGTRLMSGTALLRRYKLAPTTVGVLSDAASSLFDWIAPQLPEDVHVLRPDGSVWLGSIAHERDAWLELFDEDLAWLQREYSEVAEAIADEGDQRTFIARLWQEHIASPFPEDVAGEEITEGVPLGYLDSTVAGCISAFVSGSGRLDHARLEILKNCWADLDEATGTLEGPGKIHFHRLWRMTDLTLGFHQIDPLGRAGRGLAARQPQTTTKDD